MAKAGIEPGCGAPGADALTTKVNTAIERDTAIVP